jgi:hypothetical protein
MSYQSYSTNFQINIVENGKSVLTTNCTVEYYDSDSLDCAELDITTETEITDDDMSDAVQDFLSDFFKDKKANEWDAIQGKVIQLNYNREDEVVTMEK